VSLTVILFLF